jgi:hypothetical protein
MKSKIVPVILFCIAFPWIASRVFQMEGHQERLHKNCRESRDRSRPVTTGRNFEISNQLVSYEELSNKQIIYLIP